MGWEGEWERGRLRDMVKVEGGVDWGYDGALSWWWEDGCIDVELEQRVVCIGEMCVNASGCRHT